MSGKRYWVGSFLAGLLVLSPAHAQVVITEIMYNPASTEGGGKPKEGQDKPTITRAEWVEITNTSDEEVDLAGWTLKNSKGSCTALPDGATLAAGAVAVIVPNTITAEEFAAAWGEGLTVWPVGQWEKGGLRNLANAPKEGETVELVDKDGGSIDSVTYLAKGEWPKGKNGHSIYLTHDALDTAANDLATNWRLSEADHAGAKTVTLTEAFDGPDVGSPGTLPQAGDETPAEEQPAKTKAKTKKAKSADDGEPADDNQPASDGSGMSE